MATIIPELAEKYDRELMVGRMGGRTTAYGPGGREVEKEWKKGNQPRMKHR